MQKYGPIIGAISSLLSASASMSHGSNLPTQLPSSVTTVIASSTNKSDPARIASDWQATTRSDLAAMAAAIAATDINAVYPNPSAWTRRLKDFLVRMTAEIPLVRNENGYRAVLQHFAASFNDAHLRVAFTRPMPPVAWPGFLARFENGSYRIGASRDPAIPVGAPISACDGEPIMHWVDTIAPLEIGLPEDLETTRLDAALRLFVDRGSPLRKRPTHCVIGGDSVTLNWRTIPNDEIAPGLARLRGRRAPIVSTRLIGTDGAWVQLGYFQPQTKVQAIAFQSAIEQAASLRDRKFIVLDVRGNGGGPYNWFMAYLRGLYGQRYADYYATARLHIRGVYRVFPPATGGGSSDGQSIVDPPDPPFDMNAAANDRAEQAALAAHRPYFVALPIPHDRSAPPPPDPVRAKVYVLTDYACGSACIGFVDELKLFPGVEQIGVPTFVDNRTGTPMPTLLPSGNARVFAPAMTRDGRMRNDNVPQNPAIRFTGDITDDAAVDHWVLAELVGDKTGD